MPFRNEGYFFGRDTNEVFEVCEVCEVFEVWFKRFNAFKREEGLNIFNPYKRLEAFFNGALCFCKKFFLIVFLRAFESLRLRVSKKLRAFVSRNFNTNL